jgi:sulfhydrogenase subunit alpha
MKSKKIKIDYLARVEGEGGLTVKVRNGRVADATFDIFEPPRLFEAFLRGRRFTEAPDITARICGICPIAYQMSSVHAMEYGCGVKVGGQLRELRRLIYCGEWIESHVLHIYMLHAPDFLGYEDAIQMAADYPDIVKNALRLKKIGNDIMVLLGGREIHPINVRVGGFYSVPSRKDLETLIEPLQWAVDTARETVKWTAGLDFPDFERDFEFVSLRHPDEYPLCEGRIVSNKGLDIAIEDFFTYFEELHVKHSTSLHSFIKERGEYHVGPLARYNNNFDKLPAEVQDAAREVGLAGAVTNPFKSIIVRALETLYACYEALRIIENYSPPPRAYIDVPPRLATTSGASEAPRGLLVHKYKIDDDGIIRSARIVPPTAQNQKVIESDLAEFVDANLELPHDKLTWKCEQIVRNYDPCISCSCHFLKLKIERE